MTKLVIFDDYVRGRKTGRRIPFWHEQRWSSDDDSDCIDQSLHWFHEGYGLFQLYRLHEVKGDSSQLYIYYIAEPLKKYARTSDDDWNDLMDYPELALAE